MNIKWYVTTPIYYVTAKPHLGSLYSTLLADVIARWQKLLGKKVFFLTGTDEHGQKVAQAAERAGKDPRTFVDSFIGAYKDTWHKYDIDYNYFMRTTDAYHVKAVQQWLQQLLEQGDIYKGEYAGWYCTPCETFVTEGKREDGAEIPLCSSCGRDTQYVAEETYFFRLSAYQDKLLRFYDEHPDFIVPQARRTEVINFVKEGLKDLSISRTTVTWGIPFPGDEKHVCYVWADALNNYITAIGYGDKNRVSEFNTWWPADTHVMGKDIVRFHAIYWPAFLMAAGLPLPKQLLVHGWIKVNHQKMSKSLGNVVDPLELYDTYGADQVRYYLVRHMAITHDGDFSLDHLEETITTDLANNIGNLLHRMSALADKHQTCEIAPPSIWSKDALLLQGEYLSTVADVREYMGEYLFHMALARVMKFISMVNAYFHGQEPWKLVKKDSQSFQEVLSAVCHALHGAAILLWPIMPQKMSDLLRAIGSSINMHENVIEHCATGIWNKKYMIQNNREPLFKKPEAQQENTKNSVESTPVSIVPEIDITDFTKVVLVVGTILTCDIVEGSDKLLKLSVDCGAHGKRTILSGIRKQFSSDELIGKQGIFVVNLKPRKMMGLESHGMMLLAEDEQGILHMATIANMVSPGIRLK